MEPHTVRPRRFDQAQEVADKFKDGQPVIMNLEGTEREVARRLIDFASGICYALDGSMEKVATGVYLLKPPVRAACATLRRLRRLNSKEITMEMNPQRVRSAEFKTVRKGADPDEVRVFLSDVADELERAQNQSTAMEARARAAVARLQEAQRGGVGGGRRPDRRCLGRGVRDDQPHAAAGPAHGRPDGGRRPGRGRADRSPGQRRGGQDTRLHSRDVGAAARRGARRGAQDRRGRAQLGRERGRGAQGATRLPRVRRPPPRDVPRRPARPGPRGGQFPARHRRSGSGRSR